MVLPGGDDGLPGAVRAAVVHDDDRVRHLGTGGEGGFDLLDELADAVLLVERRDDHGHVVDRYVGSRGEGRGVRGSAAIRQR